MVGGAQVDPEDSQEPAESGASVDGADGEAESDPSLAETCLVDVSKSRLRVLKALEGNRRTASELARELDLNKSTVHGYLQDLVGDGFARRHEDEERLWVYYSLTGAGEGIVGREKLTLAVDLSTLTAFLASASLGVYRFFFTPEPTRGGAGALGGPAGGGGSTGLPWTAIAYVGLLALVAVGAGLHLYLRRRPIDVPEGSA